MSATPSDLALVYRSDSPPAETFRELASAFRNALTRGGFTGELRAGGSLAYEGTEVATVSSWADGSAFELRWKAMPWGGSKDGSVSLRVEAEGAGSRVTWGLHGWADLFATPVDGLADWAAGEVLPAILARLTPDAIGDWWTDRRARRPSGRASRETYRDPLYHWPNFWLILDRIRLGPTDRLLEVGCGGGAFLREALRSGCSASAVDHSPEMLAVAREVNSAAVEAGRLVLAEAEADRLPVPDRAFTCCVSTGAIGFFPDPLGALREMHRALGPGGRLAIFASTPAMRGTPAAPEPVASRARFFEAQELAELGRAAGFADVRVEEPDLAEHARRAQIPEEAMPLFRVAGGSLLLTARRP